MGIWFWLCRLLGRPTGGTPCNLCRRMIPPDDLERGHAVMVARRQYCQGCVREITRRSGSGWRLSADTGSSSSVLHP